MLLENNRINCFFDGLNELPNTTGSNNIYRDLKEGLDEYEIGEIENAVFDWKDRARGHRGNHAVNLIKALHWLRTTH